MEMRGSRTEQNLMKAFAGESQARNRYTFYAEVAEQEGYLQIAQLFRETAENERSHAYGFFQLLDGGMPEFTAEYPAGPTHSTAENLRAAAEGELLSGAHCTPTSQRLPIRRGSKRPPPCFAESLWPKSTTNAVSASYLPTLKPGPCSRGRVRRLKCQECGYVHEADEAPNVCPLCGRPRSYFELYGENYRSAGLRRTGRRPGL